MLAERGVEGFVLPLTDEHHSEYLPPAAQRLTWLTGFTGSAGLAIVLPEQAAVFVDGRYTLQAEQELDPALFERCHVTEQPPAKWLPERLAAGWRLGFDPLLHTKAEVERYRAACAKAGAELVALPTNPVDAVWTTRPPPPVAPIGVLDETYAGETSAAKRARMAEAARSAGAETLVVSATDSIAWLLNLRGGDVPFNPLLLSFALLHGDGGVELFLDQRKLKPGQNFGNEVSLQPIAGFHAALERLGEQQRAVMVDPATTSYGVLERLRAAGARVIEGEEPCIRAKACKNPIELVGARDAQIRDGAAVCRFLCWLDHEVEHRPVDELDGRRPARCRAPPRSFVPRPELRHDLGGRPARRAAALPRQRREQPRARPGLAAIWSIPAASISTPRPTSPARSRSAHRRRRCAGISRWCSRATSRSRRRCSRRASSGAQLDSFARQALWQARASTSTTAPATASAATCASTKGRSGSPRPGPSPLEPGMIVSNEPGYYRGGAYGIRIENLVVVAPRPLPAGGERELYGFDTITLAPIDRRLVQAELLDAAERVWLDNYHARVRAELLELVGPDARQWLIAATAPL